jgi:putative membrane protein
LKVYDKRNYLQIILISLTAGFIGVALDLLEDPLAHHNNWWIWESSIKGITFFNVPILNFLGWFFLLFFMSIATLLIERSKFTENRKVLISITSVAITGFVILLVHGTISRVLQAMGIA